MLGRIADWGSVLVAIACVVVFGCCVLAVIVQAIQAMARPRNRSELTQAERRKAYDEAYRDTVEIHRQIMDREQTK